MTTNPQLPSYAPSKVNLNALFIENDVKFGDFSAYKPQQVVFTRILGDIPTLFPILSISKPTVRTFLGLFSPLFDIPAIDFGLNNRITPYLRRVAFRNACVGFSCMYCVAHACGLGDLANGKVPMSQLLKDGEDTLAHKHAPFTEDEAEKAIASYARASVERPFPKEKAPQLKALAEKIVKGMGEEALESVNGIICKAGELNTFASSTGVEMEDRFLSFVEEMPDIERDQKEPMTLLKPFVWVKDMFSLGTALVGVFIMVQTDLYAGLPTKMDALVLFAQERIGTENAKFLLGTSRVGFRRAFCFGLRETLFVERGERNWSAAQRAGFMRSFAEVTGASELADAASRLVEWDQKVGGPKGVGLGETEEAAADKMVRSCASGSNGELDEDVLREVVSICSPQAIVEVVGMLAFMECWRRMSLLFTL